MVIESPCGLVSENEHYCLDVFVCQQHSTLRITEALKNGKEVKRQRRGV